MTGETVTLTAEVARRVVAAGSKSEREATVADVGGRPLVLRRRGASTYDDDATLAALAGRTVRLTGTALTTTFLVDEAVPVDEAEPVAGTGPVDGTEPVDDR